MNAWEITKKDLTLLTRDRRALVILVLFPLIFITIIGITTGQLLVWGDEQQKLKIAIVDEVAYDEITADDDHRAAFTQAINQRNARLLVVEVIETLQRRDGLLTRVMDREEATRLVDDGDAHAALFFGRDFFKKLSELRARDLLDPQGGKLGGGLKSLDLQVYTRRSGTGRGAVIEDQIYGFTLQTVTPFVACKNNFLQRQIPSKCEEYEAEADPDAPLPAPRPPEDRPTAAEATGNGSSGDDGGVYQELIPSYTVMFVFFLVNIMARSFIHERDLGTLRRLRIAPLRPSSLLVGKTVPFYIISLGQAALLFLAGRLLFDMSWGSRPVLLLPVIAATSLAATGLGLVIATLVRTESQVSAYANFVVITMAGISGCFMPRDWLPPLLQQISYATPHAWALIAYDQILQSPNPNAATVFQCSGILVAFAAGFFLLGCLRFGQTD